MDAKTERAVARFVSDAKAAGISVIPKSIRFSEDSASFSTSDIDLPLVLDRSGIGKKCLAEPEDFALFCATAKASIRQIYPDSADARLLSVLVEIDSFDNNDEGKALDACNIAAGFLERYLKNFAVTLSSHLYRLLSAERMPESISCPEVLPEAMGAVFDEDGTAGGDEP